MDEVKINIILKCLLGTIFPMAELVQQPHDTIQFTETQFVVFSNW